MKSSRKRGADQPVEVGEPPVARGTDAVAAWAAGAGLELVRLAGEAEPGTSPERARGLRACLDALGRGRGAARDAEALLGAVSQRGDEVEDAAGPAQPVGEVALVLWQWYEVARLAYLVACGPEDLVAPSVAQVRALGANIRSRPTARAEELRHRHRLPKDAREAVREHEEVSARLAEESLDEGAVLDARKSLCGFGTWMRRGFLTPPHIQIIAAALEEVERGECLRLIVELPPRSGKSSLVSDLFPQWYLGRHPDRDVICATHSQEFSDGWGRTVRNGIEGEEFRRVFPTVRVSEDSRAANRFNVVQEGSHRARAGVYKAFGRTAKFTGSGANLLLVDDLTAEFEADSDASKREAHRAVQGLRSRLAPRSEGSAWVIVNTRYREDDTIGYVLTEYADDGPWRVLRFPALAEEDESWDLPGGGTWSRSAGDPLWPERYTREEIEALRAVLLRTSPQDWYGQWLCRPVPASGAVVDMSWWKRYGSALALPYPSPTLAQVRAWSVRSVVSVDSSKGVKSGARTAIGAWLEVSGRGEYDGCYLAESFAEAVGVPEQLTQVKEFCARWKAHLCLIEDKSTGQALIPILRADPNWAKTPIVGVNPIPDKVTRMGTCTPQIRAGQCWLPAPGTAPWLADYEKELTFFPVGKFADQVDQTSQFLNWRRENPVLMSGQSRGGSANPTLQRALGGSWGAGRRSGVPARSGY